MLPEEVAKKSVASSAALEESEDRRVSRLSWKVEFGAKVFLVVQLWKIYAVVLKGERMMELRMNR